MKNLLQSQRKVITQQENFWIIFIIKFIINPLVEIYQDKEIQVFLYFYLN